MRLSGYCTNSVPLTVGSVVLCCLAVVLKLPEKKTTNKKSFLLKINSSEPIPQAYFFVHHLVIIDFEISEIEFFCLSI